MLVLLVSDLFIIHSYSLVFIFIEAINKAAKAWGIDCLRLVLNSNF
jgi:hypothetical protein